MDQSKELKTLLWSQKIAVKINLPPELNARNDKIPDPMYLFIYAQQFPLFYYQAVYDYFKQWLPQEKSINYLSLELRGQVIPCSIPFGIVVDKHNWTKETQFVPINLIIRFSDQLVFEDLEKEIKHQYKYNLKQGLLGKLGTEGISFALNQYTDVQTIVDVVQKVQSRTFESELDFLFKFYDKLFDVSKVNKIYLPVRIYFGSSQGRLQYKIECQSPKDTIGLCLNRLLPKVYHLNNESNQVTSECKTIFFGTEIALDIPILYFYQNLYSIDGFCHLVIQQ